MRAFSVFTLVVTAAALASVASADTIAYADSGVIGNTHTTAFGLLDLNNGVFTPTATLNVFMNDIAVGPNGIVYVLDTTLPATGNALEFGSINPTTGVITNIAPAPVALNSMAFSPGGILYSTSYTGGGVEGLYIVNPLTGAATLVANLSGPAATDANQIRFVGNTLYTTDSATPSSLYTVNLASGSTTLIGNTELPSSNGLGAALGGTLVGATFESPGQLFYINSSTGAAVSAPTTITGNPAGGGVVFATPSVPEPATWLLGATALALLAFRRRGL